VIRYFTETYPVSLLPKDSDSTFDRQAFLKNAQKLLDVFIINSFALSSVIIDITPLESAKKLVAIVKTKLPATLWSLQVLRSEKQPLINDFEIKVLKSYARRHGLKFTCLSISVENRIEVHYVCEIS
jgi:hypothetical protein